MWIMCTDNAIAIWRQYDGTDYSLYSKRLNGATWGTAELLETNNQHVHSPRIAVDTNGKAIVVWQQSDGTRINIYANRYE